MQQNAKNKEYETQDFEGVFYSKNYLLNVLNQYSWKLAITKLFCCMLSSSFPQTFCDPLNRSLTFVCNVLSKVLKSDKTFLFGH